MSSCYCFRKKAQSSNFLTIPTGVNDADGNPINTPIPGGVYMKINPSNFNSTFEDNATVDLAYSQARSANGSDNYPLLKYNLSLVELTLIFQVQPIIIILFQKEVELP